MSDLEKLPNKKKKFIDWQKDYNISSKNFVHILSANISLFVCMLLPFLLIGFIWTDIGTPEFSIRLISEGIVTVALLIIGQTMMMRIGASGGKLDDEYIKSKKDFDALFKQVNDIGTLFMPIFCEWQIEVEMKQAKAARLRHLRITKEDWEKVKDLPYDELVKKYGRKRAKGIIALNKLEPIELNEAILLFNNRDPLARGGVPMSGEEYIEKEARSPQMILAAVFAGLLTISIAVSLTQDISFARIIYTVLKLVVLLYRMAEGYNTGAKAYNTIEVRQLLARNNYLRQYVMFVKAKLYLKFGDRYGDIDLLVPDEDEEYIAMVTETPAEAPAETPATTNE